MCGLQRNKGTSRKTQSEGVETESGEHCRQDGPSKRKESDLRKRRGRKRHGEVRQTQTNWRGVCLHFDQISIFQRVVWVALQGREVADTVID